MLDQEIFRVLFAACVFGAILFFALVVVPSVFKVLEGEEAAVFWRKVIPRYFFFVIVTAGLGAFSSWEHELQALGLGFIALTSIVIRQLTLPELFLLRDQQMDGNMDAGGKFVRMRNVVLALTGAQLFISGGVLARIAS